MRRPARLALASLALLALTAHAAVAAAKTPIPERPPADRATHDLANVISPADEQMIDAVMADLQRKTGVAIVVVTVPQLVDEVIGDLALRIGQTWGVGKQGKDMGVVVVRAVQDRKLFVATGYGAEGFLPDGKVGALMDRYAQPYLRAGDTSRGLTALALALAQESAKEFNVKLDSPGAVAPPPPQRHRRSPGGSISRIILGLMLAIAFGFVAIKRPDLLHLILFSLILGGRGGGFGGGGGGFGGGGAGRDY